jgi:hypothetical protein
MKISEKDKELNPSSRGVNRYVSKIVRCPQHKSKIGVGTCESCPHFKGLVRMDNNKDFITCCFDVNAKKRNQA